MPGNDIVVIDGVTTSVTQFGESGRDEDGFTRWYNRFVRPFCTSGAAVLTVDHRTKASDSRDDWAIGTQAKKSTLTGVQYIATNITKFGPGRKGVLALKIGGKDRGGSVEPHAHPVSKEIVRFTLDSRDTENPVAELIHTGVTDIPEYCVGIKVPLAQSTEDLKGVMVDYIRHNLDASTKMVKSQISGSSDKKEALLRHLLAEGRIERIAAVGPGKPHTYVVREDAEGVAA